MNSTRETRKKLEEDNLSLKKNLSEMQVVLKNEQQRPWWKNASELALASLDTLKNMAHVILPAMPNPMPSMDLHTR